MQDYDKAKKHLEQQASDKALVKKLLQDFEDYVDKRESDRKAGRSGSGLEFTDMEMVEDD